jgi:hypothetical protein
MGPGSVLLEVGSNGRAQMRSRENGQSDDVVSNHILPVTEVAALARTIDESGLLCQTTQVRDGYKVFDLGRFEIRVSQGGYSKSIYIDECHTVPDTWAFDGVIGRLTSFKDRVGSQITWGPYGTASVSASCKQ